jgi:MFS family permease
VYLTLDTRPRSARTADGARPVRAAVPRVVITLGIVSLLTDVSSEAVAAILPIYLTTVVGLGSIGYGIIDGLQQGVSAFVRLAGGWTSDRTDHPKWVALVGYGLSAVARIGLLFAAGAGAIATVVTADRIGKGIRTAPRDAMIAASSDPTSLGRNFGVHRTLDTIGAALGPLIAFVILWQIPQGYLTVMAVSLACAVIGVAALGLFVPDVRPRQASAAPSRLSDLRDPRLARVTAMAAVLGVLTVSDGFVYLALLDRGGFAATWFPLLVVGTNVVFLALAVPLGRVSDRFGRGRMLVGGHLALVAAYLVAASPGNGWWATFGALACLGAFYAATDGSLAALASRCVAPSSRASGIAAAQTATALARLVASMGFGLLWFLLGPQVALLVVAAALVVVIPVAWFQLAALDDREVTP